MRQGIGARSHGCIIGRPQDSHDHGSAGGRGRRIDTICSWCRGLPVTDRTQLDEVFGTDGVSDDRGRRRTCGTAGPGSLWRRLTPLRASRNGAPGAEPGGAGGSERSALRGGGFAGEDLALDPPGTASGPQLEVAKPRVSAGPRVPVHDDVAAPGQRDHARGEALPGSPVVLEARDAPLDTRTDAGARVPPDVEVPGGGADPGDA